MNICLNKLSPPEVGALVSKTFIDGRYARLAHSLHSYMSVHNQRPGLLPLLVSSTTDCGQTLQFKSLRIPTFS